MLYKDFDETALPRIEADDETKGALHTLRRAFDIYGDRLLYACSFGVEGSVLLHLISRVKPNAEVLFLDTDFHFDETYDTIKRTEERYPQLDIKKKKPKLTVQEQEDVYGAELWKVSPDECCRIRKVEPLEEELGKVDAWISGLRREQSPTRAHVEYFNKDERFGIIKVCPLIHWTWEEIWSYVKKYDLPYNLLHDQSYPSIGCLHCTLPSKGGGRDGRWQGSMKTECGLHNSPKRKEAK